ncbi:hypothetical protein BC351_00225 [Paenibacillus ferrarius]|uniref:Peptidase C1A papain C-terminal domain-containing protein n=1 Tax=Paenibacillus ferrarius TaxID=1469647 RepID=A0A1V4HT78_9BACL|nr:C1 family peptidase [Paenibacillus ferrarius]OPH61703.1 hypothetical protein BC351_00225 [Paenibacillus ferrarius]
MNSERQYLLKPDQVDSRDYIYMASGSNSEFKEIDLRSKDIPEIFDQLNLGACAIFSITELMMYWMKQNTPSHYYFYLSQLFLYYKTRETEGTIDWDSGISIRNGLRIAQQIGVCRESFFPYDISKYKVLPSREAEKDAADYKINDYHRIMTVTQLKSALSEGCPVVLGIEVWNSFEYDEVKNTGFVPLPDKTKESIIGYHAMLIMGWKKIYDKEYMIVRNSYGQNFGDNGYLYIPMDFIGRYVTDMWVAK